MIHKLPDFAKGATNIYRTKHYIVTQVMGIKLDCEENNVIYSHDTYYRRNFKRDAEYEKLFVKRKHINGKRLHSTMYERTYID